MNGILPTGILALDLALQDGGLPPGSLVEIYGPEKCGKTALCLCAVAEMQKQGGTAAFIDIDETLDASRAGRMGIDVQKVIYARPEDALQALETAKTLVHSGAIHLLVFDSVTGLLTLGAKGPQSPGGSPAERLLTQAVRELDALARQAGTILLFTNTLRERPGYQYGVPVTTPGGMALKLHAAIRLELTPVEMLRAGASPVGEKIQVKIVKPNSRLFHTIIINIMYNGVVSRLDNLFDLAIELDIINKQGSFYSYEGFSLGKGRQAALAGLEGQPQLQHKIETAVRIRFLSSSG